MRRQQSWDMQKQQYSQERTETQVTRQQITQQRVQGEMIVQTTPTVPTFSGRPGDPSPPVFEQIFKNARFAQGGNAIFEGRVKGNPKPVVSWTHKGAPLLETHKILMSYDDKTGNVKLQINQIGPGDEGEYTCHAKNQYGEGICSVYIQPEGFGPPPIQQQGSYKKEVSRSYQQYTNGSNITTTEDFKVDIFEYRILRETEFRESITRRYVGESDSQITTVADRSLGPVAPPQITQKPRSSKLSEGSEAVFSAKISGNPKPRLTWFKDGQRLRGSQHVETIYSNQTATLKIHKVSSQDTGHYSLLTENPQGCTVSSAYLAVESNDQVDHAPVQSIQSKEVITTFQSEAPIETPESGKILAPNFVRTCTDRDVTEGKMTRFDCRVTGRPYPEVTWYINGFPVANDATHKILVNESGSNSLMITDVSRSDGGVVTCVARNKAGETSFQCNLNVIEKEQVLAPKFVERFTTTTVKEGEPVSFTARAVATPPPRITWQKDGVPITLGPDVRITTDGSGASTLDIPFSKLTDAAWYQCTAQNVAGSTATRARLFVESPKGAVPEPPRRLNLPRPTKVIEPEPAPGPEVIYLRHVERAKPYLPPSEEDRIYPPPRFIIPLRDAHQIEGGRIHFEARIEPVGDPTMRVEWYINGRAIDASSRATSVFRFGFIALDLISIVMEDSGEYLCRVVSSTGVAESRATLSVTPRATIEQTSQNPDSLRYIQQLEDYSKYQRQESVGETSSQRPVFIRPLQDLGELQEGRNAHFEAQLTPVSDPTMKVEWYKDGRPITASSRITTIFNFGYVSLNIMHLRSEDAGSYTVRALNRSGEAISTASLRVFARTTITADLGIPEQQRYIEAAEELEAYQQAAHQKYVQEQPEKIVPPVFKTPIKDQISIREGGFAHYEAQLEPVGDASLRVEWLKDGRPVEASSRITTFFNFGYVALTIKYVTIHDVGIYTCRAYNRAGEAHTTAQLSVITKNDIIYDSQHPSGLQKIQSLEDSSRYSRKVEEEKIIKQPPRFLGPLKGTNKIVEGQRAHFEARVEPQSDLTMKIEWYHNGKPITAANRIQTYHDFGYVAIDILQVRPEDAGTYTVVARNNLGEAKLSATMMVETRSSIDTSSMHREAYEKTQRFENAPFVEPQYYIEEISKSKPIFVQPLSDPPPVSEGKNIHLECRLEPMGDPTMRVEWFQNGKPVTVGSRFRTYYDFGFVALDIIHTSALDAGEYTVRATNHLGSAHTSACVRVIGRSDVVTDTQNEQSLEQIQMLEDSSRYRRTQQEEVTVQQAPQFTRPLHNIETVELTNVHLECRLQPVGDASMRVVWLVNGKPVKTGHRFRPSYEFDYVALDILGVYPDDSGVYTCQAYNQLGEAITSCSVRVHAKKDLILKSQHPEGLERIQYLEDASKYKRHELVDEVVNVKPRFITHPKNQENLREGHNAHFECKLEPVTDSNLKVEWLKNGRPIQIGHRFRPIHDFGYVALEVIGVIAEDSGVYTCRAENLVGRDEVNCTLNCRSTAQILTDTQNESGLEQIHYLEDRSKYQRREDVEEITTQAPIFTTSLNNVEIKEGQRAHFECRLIPVSDATMKVEWFHNNLPVKAGSRFVETNSFGFVALDIMYAYPEDAGTYTCRARNAIGEAITSATAVVHSKKSIYLETQNEEALQKVRQLEDHSRYQRKTVQEETVSQAPVFTMPIKDLQVAENQAAHFEARVIPVGDSKLVVQWLRNGVPISASNRITTMHDFGYVALNMKYVTPEDAGTYTCRAVNDLGEAVTSATLFVQSKAALQFESQHEGALSKLQALEDTNKYQRREEEDIVVNEKPRFTVQLNGPTNLVEGQSAHYECRIEPYPDTNLKVEWFHNGKPLSTGHRYRTAYDFGFASLDVLSVYAEDSGTYTCRATNKLGQEQSSINLDVKSRASIIRETQHEGALKKIQYLEDDSRYKRTDREDVIIAEKPKFGRPLKNIEHLPEGKSAHLEATLTPVNDPTMVVEWYRDGRPIPQGHKFKTTYDFGYVALDIMYAYPEDSGTYMCKARNAVGEAVTTCVISVDCKQGLYLDTLDAQRLEKIRQLETVEVKHVVEKEIVHQKPVFLTPLNNLDHLKEGEHAHLECRVEPINDANLKIEWFVNGKAVKTGHRFRTTHDFGYVALDILYSYAEDSGTYMCKATNLAGEAVNTCTIKVGSHRSLILDTQHPDGLEKIRELEAQGRPARLEVEEPPVFPPKFVTELRGTTEIYEGQTAHFECQIEPLHDANLRIEFFHNGKPLPSASRFHVTFDFGYVALDISHAVPEDAGQYSVRAINALGQCVSSIELKVIPKDNIILESQRPEGLDKIRELESLQPWKRPDVPEPQTRQRPVFTQPLQNIDAIAEGQTAHFECRLIPVGDPTLKVEWFRNEKPLETSSRITKVHDFGYVSLDITHVREEDEGVYMCRASNPLGEAVTTASMKIQSKANIQLDTQHPESQRKIARLEADKVPTRAEEPEKVFDKPIFTQLLTGPTELWEGQIARYECRVVPVGDASLRFEWYVNGVELKMGSRYHVNHDFGFVTLDIMKVIPEDSGVYTCKAINNAGEAVSSISLKVKARSAISGDAIQPDAWKKIQLKEAEMNKVPEMFVDTTPQQAPVFTTHLKSYDKLVEGQHVYLEAQVEPRADPNLRVEWFKNSVPLQIGTRLKSTFDFGLVSLSINGLRPDDSAIYTCKATNLLGEAVSTSSLKIADRHWLLGDTLHPDALSKISALEQPPEGTKEQPEPTYEEPVFISHLNNVECTEGDNVHFECNVEPSKDPTMKIEWFLNGKPLPYGARYKSTYDFGYVALDLNHAYEEDSGVITVKATNSKGSAQTSGTLKCTSKQSIYLQTQHPQGQAGLEKVKEVDDAYASKAKRSDSGPEKEYPKPIWTVPLQPEFKLGEAEPLHLEGQVEPKDDPNLKIEWYFNGKILQHGARFKMTCDFGFVTLDLTDVYDRDSGIYTCKAYNKAGEAFTSSTIYCSTKENVIERSQHPKGKEGLEAIQDLEESLRKQPGAAPESEGGHAPSFTSQSDNLSNLSEGELAHFEATLIPTGDQTMVVEWFFNENQIEASHRIRTVYAFGTVVLEVLGTKIEDSGTYTCRATNKWGKAEISLTLECIDKSMGQKPRFTTQIQSLEGLKDNQSAHFQCTLIPVGDPNMKVEWFHNGQPLRHSSRFKMVSDFGFVVMDIAGVMSHDSGEYVCKASNKYGEDYTKATIKCFGKSGVYLDSLQPDSLAKIRELEAFTGEQYAAPVAPVAEPPKFITQITDITKLVEGQSAHFEARLTPVTDPDLKIEWYYNGKKLPQGHRYRTFHDFGIVILDILYCYEENSGEYECRAVNKYGQDSTKATLRCLSKANLILESQLPKGMEGGLEKIQTLEDAMIKTREEKVTETKGKAPVFTVPLSNLDGLREGESAHFEARLTPTDDPKLKVEWFWNGKPLRTGTRFRTFCDFGFVILEISPIYPEDSGEYSCRATNDYGEAVTTCSMKCTGKRSIILESQLPKGMEGTIDKIAELEGLGAEPGQPSPDDDTGKPPEFITTPSDLTLSENSLAHFECRLQPVNDSSMRVEWFHNGKPLLAGSRVKTIYDFGFVILEVANCYQRDSGLYTCKAVNRHGEATVNCKLQVRGRQGIILEPQLPNNFKTGTESIQKLEESLYKKDEILPEEEKPSPPRFIVELKNIEVNESESSHFDCRVEPTGDSTMRIDWYHNGRPFATGSRVHQINDFGFISLDLSYTYARDSGEYVCRATNKWGSAITKATITCTSKKSIDFDSQLPSGMSGEKLKELERGPVSVAPPPEAPRQPPRFITQIKSFTVDENEPVRFECQVEPKDDPNLRIEWYRNGKLIPAGHRYRTVYDMGFVSMDILYVYPEDSGEYVCKAINDLGEDTTRASVSCKQQPSIILQNQVPKGMKKSETLMQMEATIKKYTSEVHLTEDDLYDAEKKQPPRFVTQITDQVDLVEMNSTKFECQLAPVGDPNMRVEWFLNGKPLLHKNRFNTIYDFGYVALSFGWVYPEDSGEYVCRATNLYGMDETKAIIRTAGKPGIIYDSQLPKGMKSIEKIREMEAAWQVVPEEETEVEKVRSPPTFVSKPEPFTVEEGDWSRFCCRVTGHPRPRVMWLINGHTVVSGSRYKLTYDGMYHLDIPKTRQYDNGKVEVIARSSVGEARTETTLTVKPRSDDYRGVLKTSPKRIVGTKEYRKPEWVTQMEEMQEALRATQSVPRFIQEFTDTYTTEGETIVLECIYSGNPVPDIVWFKNDKIILNHDNIKIKVFEDEKKTSLIINEVTHEDAGVYVCKATSDIGLATTKAKLQVTDSLGRPSKTTDDTEVEESIPEQIEKPHKKKKPEVKKAKEIKEKIKSERIKTDKKSITKEKGTPKEQPEEKNIVVESLETQILNNTESIEEKPRKLSRAKKIIPVQESVITEATPSLKKVDEKQRDLIPKLDEIAKAIVEEQQGIVVSETTSEDIASDFVVESVLDQARITSETFETVSVSEVHTETDVREIRRRKKKPEKTKITQKDQISEVRVEQIIEEQEKNIAQEVEEIMEMLNAPEFGPGEQPLRELATIGYLVRHGITVYEINESLYRTDKFPALKTPDAQNALVQLVERKGHGPLITQVLTEETTTDESIVAATVGFRAFMKMVELQHATVEEIITHFTPEDFRPRAWEVTEATEHVEIDQTATEKVEIIHKTEVHVMERREDKTVVQIQDVREIKEEATLSITKEEDIDEEVEYAVRNGDAMFSICSYVAETDEAINLVEGERVYIIEHTNSDWWFVRKNITQEKGWVPAQYLLDEAQYTIYLQRKLHEKIDKLPVFEKPAPGDKTSAPRFIEKLQPIHTPDGYTVQFECQVEGIPRPQITWFRQTAIIKPSPDFQMFYDEDNVATLIIKEVFPEDAGTFTCVAKNTAGFASSTTELTVEIPGSEHGSDITLLSRKSLSRESSLADILEGIPPTFSKQPKAKCVKEGEDVIIECRLVAVPEPEITWVYENKKITSKDNVIVATESDMHMYCSVIKITKVLKQQEGKYTIIAKNREGEAIIEMPLKVQTGNQEPPEILEPLKPFAVREGETVVLSTQIVGNPSPKITWFKEGQTLRGSMPKKDGNINTLTLIQPRIADSGEYSVIAKNELGTAETKATLTVEAAATLDAALALAVELAKEDYSALHPIKEIPSGAPEPPLFTERFQELTVPEKGTFKLIAKVTGNPVPEVTWLRNNKPLDKSPNITESYDGENISLEIRNANSEVDAGDYKCLAVNPVGKTSHGAKITVDVDKVMFTKKLERRKTIDEYKCLELTCETSHTVSTTWWHNDKEISGMDHREVIQEGKIHKLVIKRISQTDEGTYKCTVKNQKTFCDVTVKASKPEFVKKLQDFEVTEREEAILEVEITSQIADVSWFKDGVPLTPTTEKVEFIKDGTLRKLLIRSTSIQDEGEYTCALVDQECTAEVTIVELPPEIITKMQDVTIAEGEKATFEIELTKGDALVRWFKNDQELQFSEHIQLSIDGKRQKLKIYNSKIEDTGVYSCQVGEQTSAAKLTVEEPGVEFIKRLPEVTLVPLNEDAAFEIELSKPNIPVKWLRKGQEIHNSPKYIITDDGPKKKLVVKKCTVEDALEYSVIATNVKSYSKLKVEVVEAPPTISMDSPKVYKVKTGDDVEMSVNFTAAPKPADEWTVNGCVIQKSKKLIPTIDEESATLTIKKVQKDDVGDYTLKLTNVHGDTTINIKLIIMQVPSAPSAPEPTNITNNSITLNWNKPAFDGNCEITEYFLEYREKEKTTWTKVSEKITETIHNMAKLTTNKEYTFRTKAVNEVGPSEPSPNSKIIKITESAKLSEDKPGAPRGPLEVSGMTKTSFTIKWQPPESDGGSPITEYIVEIKETSQKTWKKLGTTKEEITYIAVADLKTDVSYDFRITAKNKIGTGPPYVSEEPIVAGKRLKITKVSEETIYALLGTFPGTKVISCKTPPSPPTNVHVTNITSRSVTLNWSPPISNGGTEITGYIIEKRPLAGKGSRWTKVVTLDGTVLSHVIENLKESEFLFRVFAENSLGLSLPATSEPVLLKSHAVVPSPPTAPLEIRQIAGNTISIGWGRPEFDGGALLEAYKIAIRDIKKTMWMEVGRVNAGIQKLTIKDLQENHEYLFRIYAKNEVGFSEPLESEEPFKILPASELAVIEPVAEAPDRGETTLSFSTENTSSWLRDHNMDADIHSYARARLLRKDEYFFRIWHYAKKLFE